MIKISTSFTCFCKVVLCCGALLSVSACSTNPATGKSQFAGLMSPAQENKVGASEHEKITKQFGFYKDKALNDYVSAVGQRVARDTERSDVKYKFFVLDSPIVNAFALPGGYIYVSRGLLALANSEAELAGVLSHEIGHVTGRHSAERYSKSVLASIGTTVLSAAVGQAGISQALSTGANLYLSSYSRGQENEADSLGIRYLSRGNYDPRAMSIFLDSMNANTGLQGKIQDRDTSQFNYFSTHPATADRVSKTVQEAKAYKQGGDVGRKKYLSMINNMLYGDSVDQGFARDNTFYHPKMGFAFDVPKGFHIINQPDKVVATSKRAGSVVLFDIVSDKGVKDPRQFLSQKWLNGQKAQNLRAVKINGMNGASASFEAKVNGRDSVVTLVNLRWSDKSFARFQVAAPVGGAALAVRKELSKVASSFRRLSQAQRNKLRPDRVKIFTAGAGDSVASLARMMPFSDYKEERFRVLNAIAPGQEIVAGEKYKTIQR